MRGCCRFGRCRSPEARRFQAVLLDVGWSRDRWDFAFLLDVLEHMPDDTLAMHQVRQSLRADGSVKVTALALPFLWSYNDEFSLHKRRYCVREPVSMA